MERIVIEGKRKLNGSLKIMGAKNAILPILAASVLCKDEVVLTDIPNLTDIDYMCDILSCLGVKIKREKGVIILNSKDINSFEPPKDLTKKLRASFFMLGPLLALFNHAKVCYPGGCNIGNRPIDIHLIGLTSLGVDIKEENDYIICDATNMKAGEFFLRFPSVGATENLMMASVFICGTTKLLNVAKEPEIIDLANFLNGMGAKVKGAGTSEIVIEGVKKLHGVKYSPISDRIVAGTYLLATLISGGDVELSNTKPKYLKSLIEKLEGNNCTMAYKNDRIRITCKERLNSIPFLETMPYPGFPTDLQAQMVSLMSVSKGISVLKENLFETRFKHIPQLNEMGANIIIKDNTAIITGVKDLVAKNVFATDLRAGAGLILCGLKADGITTIGDIYHIDRGYDHIENDLKILGAEIKRIND